MALTPLCTGMPLLALKHVRKHPVGQSRLGRRAEGDELRWFVRRPSFSPEPRSLVRTRRAGMPGVLLVAASVFLRRPQGQSFTSGRWAYSLVSACTGFANTESRARNCSPGEYPSMSSITSRQKDCDPFIGRSEFDRATERCRANGWRLTPIRRHVMEQICGTHRTLRAYELTEWIGDDHRVAAPTRVYRALEFLTEHGFVRHLKSIGAFVWCGHRQGAQDAPYLICDRCGSAAALTDPAAQQSIREGISRLGFSVDLRTMELHGLCGDCSAQNPIPPDSSNE